MRRTNEVQNLWPIAEGKNKQRQRDQQSDASGNLINHCCMDRTAIWELGLLDRRTQKASKRNGKNCHEGIHMQTQAFPEAFRDNWPSIDSSLSRLPRKEEEHYPLLLLI